MLRRICAVVLLRWYMGAGSMVAAQEEAANAEEENIFAGIRDLVVEQTGEGGWITPIQIFSVVLLRSCSTSCSAGF